MAETVLGPDEARAMPPENPREFAGAVIIEWPAPLMRTASSTPAGALTGWPVRITDAISGEPITTVTGLMVVHADAEEVVWAELTMFADEDGQPLPSGAPVLVPGAEREEILTGTFCFVVAEMRVQGTVPALPGPFGPIQPVPIDEPAEGWCPEPRKWQYHVGGTCATPQADGTCGCGTRAGASGG